jgi:hypothetical protein
MAADRSSRGHRDAGVGGTRSPARGRSPGWSRPVATVTSQRERRRAPPSPQSIEDHGSSSGGETRIAGGAGSPRVLGLHPLGEQGGSSHERPVRSGWRAPVACETMVRTGTETRGRRAGCVRCHRAWRRPRELDNSRGARGTGACRWNTGGPASSVMVVTTVTAVCNPVRSRRVPRSSFPSPLSRGHGEASINVELRWTANGTRRRGGGSGSAPKGMERGRSPPPTHNFSRT